MQVIFEGHLSYEVPLVSVLEQVMHTQLAGPTVLQLADPMTGARGDILINDCRILVGAQMYEPKAMGYPALRTLCAFGLADYRLVQPDSAKANRGDHSLNLDIDQILPLIPQLPEDPNQISNSLERVFSNTGSMQVVPSEPDLNRLDPTHASGLFPALSVEVIQRARSESWKPLQGNGMEISGVMPARPGFQTLSDRAMDEMPDADGNYGHENNGRAKIKYRASNPFRSPKDFVLTIVSLFGVLLPRVILPALAVVFLYQAGSFMYNKYKSTHATASYTAPAPQTRHATQAPAPVKNVFLRAKPKPAGTTTTTSTPAPTASAPPPVETPQAAPPRHVEASKPAAPKAVARAPVKREPVKHAAAPHAPATAHAKPEPVAKPASNEPIPEYKGPSSATGEAPKHRHAYQTMPTE